MENGVAKLVMWRLVWRRWCDGEWCGEIGVLNNGVVEMVWRNWCCEEWCDEDVVVENGVAKLV